SWDYGFMCQTMTKRFVVETLKKHSEQLMLEREKALLPVTQPIVERIKKLRELYNLNGKLNSRVLVQRNTEREALHKLRRDREDLMLNGHRMRTADINASETLTDTDQSDDEREKIRRHHAKLPDVIQQDIRVWRKARQDMKRLQEERRANYTVINRIIRKNERRIAAITNRTQEGQDPHDYATSSSDEDDDVAHERRRSSKRTFVRACPAEECRGFLSNKWTCGLCNTSVCSKCHEVKDAKDANHSHDEHVCDPNSVATAQMLSKDTRACPKCGVQIHKIDGCNMMFCTQCHTPFCWKTGEVIKNERIHNPHYYEWLRQNSKDGTIPREPGDDPGNACNNNNNRIYIRMLREKLADNDLLSYDVEDMLWNVHRADVHIEMVEIARLVNIGRVDNIDIRIRYLLNECTETAWRHELYRRAKRADKNLAIRHVYEMVHAVINDEFRKIMSSESLAFMDIVDCTTVIENLRNYANQQLAEISRIYECRVPKIEDTWRISNQREEWTVRKRKHEPTAA
ncbi:hypothetical protein EBT25_15030, partial [bacterium]|nr:hypothetical protein [bacterium]